MNSYPVEALRESVGILSNQVLELVCIATGPGFDPLEWSTEVEVPEGARKQLPAGIIAIRCRFLRWLNETNHELVRDDPWADDQRILAKSSPLDQKAAPASAEPPDFR
jgi:hypothetical protein